MPPKLASYGLILTGLFVLLSDQSGVSLLLPGLDRGLGLRLDILSASLLIFIGFLGAVIGHYASRNLAGQGRTRRFALLLTAVQASLLVFVSANDLVFMAIGWSVSGLAFAALIGHANSLQVQQSSATVRRRLLLSDAAVWAAVVIGWLTLPGIERGTDLQGASPVALTTVLGLVVAAAVVRSSLVPAHAWLLETSNAPSPVSALLHAGLVNGGGVMILLLWGWFTLAPLTLIPLFALGAATVIVATALGRARGDVKGQLVHSTSAQMGYMCMQIGLGLPAAALLHIIGHGSYKSWLFLRAGGSSDRLRARAASSVNENSRVGWATSGAMVVATVVTFAVLGLPVALTSAEVFGPVIVVPTTLAFVAVVLGGMAARRAAGSIQRATVIGVLAGIAGAGYLFLLLVVERAFISALPDQPLWSSSTSWLLSVMALGTLAVAAWVCQTITRNISGSLSVLACLWAMPVAHRRALGQKHAPAPSAQDTRAPVVADRMVERVDIEEGLLTLSETFAPAWPLRNFVASNPLAGLESIDFDEAHLHAQDVFGARTLLPLGHYGELFRSGRIQREHVLAALVQAYEDCGLEPLGPVIQRQVDELIATTTHTGRDATWAMADRNTSANDGHAAHWVARAWGQVSDSTPLWATWRTAAETRGYRLASDNKNLRPVAACLADDPVDSLVAIANHHGLASEQVVPFLMSQAKKLPGWTAHARWRDYENLRLRDSQTAPNANIAELLCLNAVIEAVSGSAPQLSAPVTAYPSMEPLVVGRSRESLWQRAFEIAVTGPIIGAVSIAAKTETSLSGEAPALVDVITCIDVRSERLRRALERRGHRTFGFAGFFGVALEYQASPDLTAQLCPALLAPTHHVRATSAGPNWRLPMKRATGALNGLPVTPLVLAELGGLVAALGTLVQTAFPHAWQRVNQRWTKPSHAERVDSLSVAQAAQVVEQTLRAIGLVKDFSPLLVVCGHGATVENNPFSTGYDCGACGGNAGGVNAEVFVRSFNNPHVRDELAFRGIVIPRGTVAVAALHNTTTDDVQLLSSEHGESPLVEAFIVDCVHARSDVLAERARMWSGSAEGQPLTKDARLIKQASRRAGDWSEPFPEWGLVGNSVFIVGPRGLTKNMDLDGRAFLHSYDPSLDTDHATLAAILGGPAIVTQWINSQYYFSTVNPTVLGAGDKTTHNVIGDAGVITGSAGDLRVGLPWQAAFDRDPTLGQPSSLHDPVRLTVVIWADPTSILPIVASHEALARLVTNQWIHLVAINPQTRKTFRLIPDLDWIATNSDDDVDCSVQPLLTSNTLTH